MDGRSRKLRIVGRSLELILILGVIVLVSLLLAITGLFIDWPKSSYASSG
jgi:hypothetical protein